MTVVMFNKDGVDAVQVEECTEEEWRVLALSLVATTEEVVTLEDETEFVVNQGLDTSMFANDSSAEEAEMFFTTGTRGEYADFAVFPLHSTAHELDEPAIVEAYMSAHLRRGEAELDEDRMNAVVGEVLALRPCVVLVALRADGEEVGDDEYNQLYEVASTLGNAVLSNGVPFAMREERVNEALARAEQETE